MRKAEAEWDKAEAEWDKARDEWVKARDEWEPYLTKLHTELCPQCPWDGRTIFPT